MTGARAAGLLQVWPTCETCSLLTAPPLRLSLSLSLSAALIPRRLSSHPHLHRHQHYYQHQQLQRLRRGAGRTVSDIASFSRQQWRD